MPYIFGVHWCGGGGVGGEGEGALAKERRSAPENGGEGAVGEEEIGLLERAFGEGGRGFLLDRGGEVYCRGGERALEKGR